MMLSQIINIMLTGPPTQGRNNNVAFHWPDEQLAQGSEH